MAAARVSNMKAMRKVCLINVVESRPACNCEFKLNQVTANLYHKFGGFVKLGSKWPFHVRVAL